MFKSYLYLVGSYNSLIAPFYIFSCTLLIENKDIIENLISSEDSTNLNKIKTEGLVKANKPLSYKNITKLSKLFSTNKLPYIIEFIEIPRVEIDLKGTSNIFNYYIDKIILQTYTKLLNKLEINEGDWSLKEHFNNLVITGDFKKYDTLKYKYVKEEITSIEVNLLINYRNYFIENKLEYYNTFYPNLRLLTNEGKDIKDHLLKLIDLYYLPNFYIKSRTFSSCHKLIKDEINNCKIIKEKIKYCKWILNIAKELYNAKLIDEDDFRYYRDI